MASYLRLLNRLLPFATPGTPLIQDVVHLAAICGILYFAPQIQEWLQSRPPGHPEAVEQREQSAVQELAQNLPAEHDFRAVDEDGVDDVPDENVPLDDAAAAPANGHVPEPFDREDGEVDQAGPAHPLNLPAQRNVGAKKAKALARKDQRRAYNEFMRSQGDAQRARDAEGAAEREASMAAERERRRVAEAALEAQKAKERKLKREQDAREWQDEIARRELAVSIVKQEVAERRMCDLSKVARQISGDVDEEWVEKILKASGMIGRKGDVMTMVTGKGWVVRVTAEDMARLYQTTLDGMHGNEDGRIEYNTLGSNLQTLLQESRTVGAT